MKRSMLASSRAASTSSSTQNGLGRLRKMASSRATQVSVFSPPLSSEMLRGSLPGGRATISMPLSRMSTPSSSDDVGVAAAEQIAEKLLEMPLDRLQRFGEQPPAVGVDLLDDLFQRSLGAGKVLELVGKRLVAGFERLRVRRGLRGSTLPMALILRRSSSISCCTSSRCCSSADGLLLESARFDAVILAQPVDQRGPLVPDLVGRQILGVQSLLDLADLAAELSATSAVSSAQPLPAAASRSINALDGFAGERFLAQDRARRFPIRAAENVPAATLLPFGCNRPVAGGRRRWLGAAPGWLSSICRSRG